MRPTAATGEGAQPKESLSPCKRIGTVACGLLAVWALTNTSPVIAANQVIARHHSPATWFNAMNNL